MKKIKIISLLLLFVTYLYGDSVDGSYGSTTYQSRVDIQKEACKHGNMDGCLQVALNYSTQPKEIRDDKSMVDYANMACDGGNGNACTFLSLLYGVGDGKIKKDTTKATEYMNKSCDNKSAFGCAFLGELYTKGFEGIPADSAKGVQYYSRACDIGEKNSSVCMLVGFKYHEGKAVPKDYKKAREYYMKDIALNGQTSSSYLNLFEIDLVENKASNPKFIADFRRQFAKQDSTIMYLDMLDIFRQTALGKQVNTNRWLKKYKNQKKDGWDFEAIDEWIKNNKNKNTRVRLANLRKIFKEVK